MPKTYTEMRKEFSEAIDDDFEIESEYNDEEEESEVVNAIDQLPGAGSKKVDLPTDNYDQTGDELSDMQYQEVDAVRPIYVRGENGVYTHANEEVSAADKLKAHQKAGEKWARKDDKRWGSGSDRRKGPVYQPKSEKEKRERIAHAKQELRLQKQADREKTKVSAADKLKAHQKAGEKWARKDDKRWGSGSDRRKGPVYQPKSEKEKRERIAHAKQELRLQKQADREKTKAKQARQRNEDVEQIEENVLHCMQKVASTNRDSRYRFNDGSVTKISVDAATKMLQTFGSLNPKNQGRFAQMAQESKDGFNRLSEFAQNYKQQGQ